MASLEKTDNAVHDSLESIFRGNIQQLIYVTMESLTRNSVQNLSFNQWKIISKVLIMS